jgi:phosphoribosylformimino-5-aminoimidazole carboxamide ribotide isomerase
LSAVIVIPAIDLKDGSYVRLYQGDFNRQTHYGDDPVELACRYRLMGFSHLHVVDLDGALSGEQKHRPIVSEVVGKSQLTVQLGGGIRSRESIRHWLDSGVTRCVVGSLAVTEPQSVADWLTAFGADRIVLALDVYTDGMNPPRLATHGWTRTSELTLWQCIDQYRRFGLRHVLCTDIGHDGTLGGPNSELYRELLRRYPFIEVQASGGVRHRSDLDALSALGCSAAITGRALLDGQITAEDVTSFLRNE